MLSLLLRRHSLSAILTLLLLAPCPAHLEELLTCGWNEVRGLHLDGTNLSITWRWDATNSDLPAVYQPLFNYTSECKPAPGSRVLVTSSSGGVAVVNRLGSNVLFYARATNAHSADLLPANRLAVASSYGTNGNRLIIYDLATNEVERLSVPLWGAHGVVWDEPRQILWGLSDSFLAGYKLTNWNTAPELVMVSWSGLLDGGGHDLYPVPNSPYLMVPTALHCWLFNRDTRVFTKHPLLGDIPNIKSTDIHPVTGRLSYVQADGPWWSEHLRFLSPPNTFDFPGDHYYKTRWFIPDPPPQLTITADHSNQLRVLWPANWTHLALQQNTNLNPASWSAPAEAITTDGTNNFILVDPAATRRLFRLTTNNL